MDKKVFFNETMGAQLKAFRIEYKIKAKDVATHIGKSPAYISKLEKGQILQVKKDELKEILNYISNSPRGYDVFIEKYIASLDEEELVKDLALMNFDWVRRMIPINDELIQAIQAFIDDLNISIGELVQYINSNNELTTEYFGGEKPDFSTIKKNMWNAYFDGEKYDYSKLFVYSDYTEKQVEALLSRKIEKSNYLFIYTIVYHLYKQKIDKDGRVYNANALIQAQNDTKQFLLNYKFYSLMLKNEMMHINNVAEKYDNLLSDFDRENAKYVIRFTNYIKALSDLDVKYTNDKLRTILQNFDSVEPSFVLAFMATALEEAKPLSSGLKRDFLNEIKGVIRKYANMEEPSNSIEKY